MTYDPRTGRYQDERPPAYLQSVRCPCCEGAGIVSVPGYEGTCPLCHGARTVVEPLAKKWQTMEKEMADAHEKRLREKAEIQARTEQDPH
jgi:DnaJ-class molecular chaperone